MQKDFFIARHFWKEGRNATWEVSKKFPESLLEQLKSDYTMLENEQPKFIDYPQATVFLVYNENKDIYKRKIIEITAVTCNLTIIEPFKMENIYNEISFVKPDKLEFTLKLDTSFIPDKKLETESAKKKYFQFLFWGIGVLFALIILSFVIGKSFFNNAKDEIQDLNMPQKSSELKPQKSSELKPIKSSELKPIKTIPLKSETDINNDKLSYELKEILKKLCNDGKGWNNTVCICAYINEQFSEPSKRIAFNQWSNENCLQNTLKKDEDYLARIRRITKESDRRRIEKFFRGE